MARTARPPGTVAYFNAVQRIFDLESQVLTGVLPHAGERGGNDEERCRAWLAKVLPRRFSIGTGFVVCSDPGIPASRQTDVVIYDEIYNSPLHRELSAMVFPVEMVYGVMEVKGRLQSGDLKPTLQATSEIRTLGLASHYIAYGHVDTGSNVARNKLVARFDVPTTRKPRAYVFAYDADWSTADGFKRAWERALAAHGGHVHGVIVLTKGWYLYQVVFTDPPRVKLFTDNALLRFVNGLLTTLQSMPIGTTAMNRYLSIEAPNVEQEEPAPEEKMVTKSLRRKKLK